MHRLRSSILMFVFALFLSIFSSPAIAATDINTIDDLLKQAGSQKNLEEFCDKRSGDQMNLETWYSGKCKDADGKLIEDPFSGEGVGFSSIILLDLAEKIQGRKDSSSTFEKMIQDMNDFFKDNLQVMSNEEKNQYLAQKRIELMSGNTKGGLLGGITTGMTLVLTNPPASTKSYLAYVSSNLKKHHVIPEAMAAEPGYGFSGLSPFLPLWRAARNISYFLFILIFILYGFMMMFRTNIQAKTVISIQLALPKLIFTLLIITFSYAIVGLMVDLMYVAFYAILSLLQAQGLIYTGNLFVNSSSGQLGIMPSLLNNILFSLPASSIGFVTLIIGGPAWLGGIVSAMLGPVIGWLIGLIITLAILISYVKLFWKLITAFIDIMISLITAPLVLLSNALPGSESFGNWMRRIAANLSVFPITMVLLLLSYMLMVQPLLQPVPLLSSVADALKNIIDWFFPNSPTNGFTAQEWFYGVKNLSSGTSLIKIPLVSAPINLDFLGSNSSAYLSLLGVALLLMASKYVDIVKDALKVPPFKYGAAIGDALKSGIGLNESWAKKNYAGLPGGSRMSSLYGRPLGSPPGTPPSIAGTNINIPGAVKSVKDTI